MFSMDPVDRLSSAKTSSPRSSRASARCEPTKPAPPVINTRIYLAPSTETAGARRASAPRDGACGPFGRAPVSLNLERGQECPAGVREPPAKLLIIQDSTQRAGVVVRVRAVAARHDASLDERRQVVRQSDDERRHVEH